MLDPAAALFPLGLIRVQVGLQMTREQLLPYLERHVSGDFGDVTFQTEAESFRGIRTGEYVRSAYKLDALRTLHILTTPKRLCTLILIVSLVIASRPTPTRSSSTPPDSGTGT